MVFDTDVLIWFLRGNARAAAAIDAAQDRAISVMSYMELLQGAREKSEIRVIKQFLADFRFGMLPLTENIGHRASIYVEEYGLSASICPADAIIAATAIEANDHLITGNVRHFRKIQELKLTSFRP